MFSPKLLCLPPIANTLRDLDMRFTWVTDLCVNHNDCQDSITSLMFCPCLPIIAPTAFCGMAISIVVCPIVTTDLCVYNLFDLILYAQSTIFQLYRDGSTWVEPVLLKLGLMCLAQGPQCSYAGDARAPGPSVSNQAL